MCVSWINICIKWQSMNKFYRYSWFYSIVFILGINAILINFKDLAFLLILINFAALFALFFGLQAIFAAGRSKEELSENVNIQDEFSKAKEKEGIQLAFYIAAGLFVIFNFFPSIGFDIFSSLARQTAKDSFANGINFSLSIIWGSMILARLIIWLKYR